MSKHQKADSDLLTPMPENAYDLVKKLVPAKDWQEWALDELQNGGPRHKQVYSALLLSRMQHLVQAIEKNTGHHFSAVPGEEITSGKDEVEIPVLLPFSATRKDAFEETAGMVAHSPAHEILAFNTLLQAIEWSLGALSNAGKD